MIEEMLTRMLSKILEVKGTGWKIRFSIERYDLRRDGEAKPLITNTSRRV